jgi:hypothetical protein
MHQVAQAATCERWAQRDMSTMKTQDIFSSKLLRYPNKAENKKVCLPSGQAKNMKQYMPMPLYKNGQIIDINKLASSMSGWICTRCTYLQKIRR